ncbi:MAG TPA: Holliday junction DNA helicase RuvA, partial [Planctomycetaceae bacterium]|nr:Holliday junction DNA helicase RuvA [Planctomycetaceae bacterium]
MITNISGTLTQLVEDRATLQVGPLAYEVLIPEFVRRQLQASMGQEISLHTIFYLDGNPTQGRLSPRLVGFLNQVEREFFELFCSVDGVGAKKALRAMVRPVKDVATLIENQDVKGLSGLPGVGPATGERIIAKLRRKMPKFALLVTAESTPA